MNATNLLISIIIGLVASGCSYGFYKVIQLTDLARLQFPWLVLALPLVVIITWALKKKTLYYPYKIKDIHEMTEPNPSFWNRWMAVFHFMGASISHLLGASVGREGVIVLTTTGFVRFFNLNLQYWGPVAASVGFAAITGNKWVGIVFLIEMFTTQISQKIWVFMGSWVAILLLETLHFPHLFQDLIIPDASSYFKRFIFIFCLAIVCGYLTRIYKESYFYLSNFFQRKNIFWSVGLAVCLGLMLYPIAMQPLQSLGIGLLDKYTNGSVLIGSDLGLMILKLFFTLLFVSIGLFGGEYVPLVVVGSGLGVIAAQYFGEAPVLGLALGAFSIFAGVSRLKWTALFLTLYLTGFGFFFWAYLFYSVCLSFAGRESLYFDSSKNNFNFSQFQFNFNQRQD